jgi:YebC/PmpR family DNA-binding regulatory protein
MAGHSKWSKVKHIKAVVDVRRGRLFSKLAKEISVAARMGGGDVDGNPHLRVAVAAARAQSMPGDHIDRAIKRGTGETDAGTALEETTYEGYAPDGVALLIETATENRTVADLRLIFSKNHGNPASSGRVAYLFRRKTTISISDEQTAQQVIRLCEALEDCDDVQHVCSNFDVPEDILEKISG